MAAPNVCTLVYYNGKVYSVSNIYGFSFILMFSTISPSPYPSSLPKMTVSLLMHSALKVACQYSLSFGWYRGTYRVVINYIGKLHGTNHSLRS